MVNVTLTVLFVSKQVSCIPEGRTVLEGESGEGGKLVVIGVAGGDMRGAEVVGKGVTAGLAGMEGEVAIAEAAGAGATAGAAGH